LQIDRKRKSYFESSGLISSGLDASVTIKGENTISSSNTVLTETKRFEDLTEEEKKRFLEIQKKDEEESKSQWGDGSYEKKIRYHNSKLESNVATGNGRNSGSNEGFGSSINNVNQGPTFTVGSSAGTGGVIRNDYESKETGLSSVYTGSSHNEGSLGSVSKVGSHVITSGSSSTSTVFKSESGGEAGDIQYGSSRGVYGAAHFDETDLSSGSSTFNKVLPGGSTSRFGPGSSSQGGSSEGNTLHFGTGSNSRKESSGSIEGNSYYGTGSDFRGGSSMHTESSGSLEGTSNFGKESDFRRGSSVHTSSGNMDGNSYYGTGSDFRGGSSMHTESSGSLEGTSNFGKESDFRRGSSVHTSSGNMEGNSNVGIGLDFRGESSTRKLSSVNVNSESHLASESVSNTTRGTSVYGESSGSFGSASNFDSNSDSREWSTGDNRASTNNREYSSNNGWGATSNTDYNAGIYGSRSEMKSQEGKLLQDNRGSAGINWNANQGGSWLRTGTGGLQGGKNSTSFHESERSHVINTTWDSSGGSPKTYLKNQWRTNDDGYVRNGSSTHVEDGLLDYHEAIKKMSTGGVTNVISNIPGDDSDLSVSLSSATERQNQGFRQTKMDESETVQKWRTVDGKLYKVNNVDDWNSLISKGASTEVYEAQDFSPQNYRKPNNNKNNNPRDQEVDGKFKLYTRFKRDTQMKKCGPTRCATIKCKIGPLSKDQEVWLSFRSRAWVDTLKKVKKITKIITIRVL
jgi:hypothetical protein